MKKTIIISCIFVIIYGLLFFPVILFIKRGQEKIINSAYKLARTAFNYGYICAETKESKRKCLNKLNRITYQKGWE